MINRMFAFCLMGMVVLFFGCSPYLQQISTLKDQDVEKRRNAAFQLSTLDKIDEKMLPALLDAFSDKDPIVREFIIKSIGKMAPKIEAVPQAIRRGLGDPDLCVRRASAAVFSSMRPVPSAVLPALARALADEDSLLRSFVMSSFVDIGPIGINALVNLAQAATEKADVRCSALETLGTIGSEAKRALPDLKKLLDDQDEKVRSAAQKSIRRIELSYSGTSAANNTR